MPSAPTIELIEYTQGDLDQMQSQQSALVDQLANAKASLAKAMQDLSLDPTSDAGELNRWHTLVNRLQPELEAIAPKIEEAIRQLESEESKARKARILKRLAGLETQLEAAQSAEATAEKAAKAALAKLKKTLLALMKARMERRVLQMRLGRAIALPLRDFFNPISLPTFEPPTKNRGLVEGINSEVWKPEKPEISSWDIQVIADEGNAFREALESIGSE